MIRIIPLLNVIWLVGHTASTIALIGLIHSNDNDVVACSSFLTIVRSWSIAYLISLTSSVAIIGLLGSLLYCEAKTQKAHLVLLTLLGLTLLVSGLMIMLILFRTLMAVLENRCSDGFLYAALLASSCFGILFLILCVANCYHNSTFATEENTKDKARHVYYVKYSMHFFHFMDDKYYKVEIKKREFVTKKNLMLALGVLVALVFMVWHLSGITKENEKVTILEHIPPSQINQYIEFEMIIDSYATNYASHPLSKLSPKGLIWTFYLFGEDSDGNTGRLQLTLGPSPRTGSWTTISISPRSKQLKLHTKYKVTWYNTPDANLFFIDGVLVESLDFKADVFLDIPNSSGYPIVKGTNWYKGERRAHSPFQGTVQLLRCNV